MGVNLGRGTIASMACKLSDLVTDWGGFERLVASLHGSGSVSVEHNVTLVGRSGARRQIDVVVRHKEGLYEHLIIVECKHWKSNVERLHVDALTTSVRDLGASRGVIFSTAGFQTGAVEAAKHENVDLFRVRDLSDAEWGAPGQVVQFLLQFYQPALGELKIEKAGAIGQCSTELDLRIGGPEQSATPTLDPVNHAAGPTLESILEKTLHGSLKELTKEGFTIEGGAKCTAYAKAKVLIAPEDPIMVPQASGILVLERLTFVLGIRIDQEPFRVDRLDAYQYALAVEDCIRQVVTAASKKAEEQTVRLSPVSASSGCEDPIANGSIIKIYLAGAFPYDELRSKPMIQLPSASHDVKLSLRNLIEGNTSAANSI